MNNKLKNELKKYPHLKKAVDSFIKNKGKSEKEGHIPLFVWFFKKMYIENGINVDEVFGWSENISEEFWSWGGNSRWANVAWDWIESYTEDCIETAIELVKEYGDIDLETGD